VVVENLQLLFERTVAATESTVTSPEKDTPVMDKKNKPVEIHNTTFFNPTPP
jgi:hypothetical protein